MYQRLAGLQIVEPGYKKIRIAPEFIKGITWVQACVETVYGTLSCGWSCKENKIVADIWIPVNTTAIVKLPEKEELFLGSGSYHYEYETNLEIDRFTMESTLKEVLDQPVAVEMLEQMSPGMTQSEMLKLAYNMSIKELNALIPLEGARMFEAVLDALNSAFIFRTPFPELFRC